MKKFITEIAKLATFGAIIFALTLVLFNLYAWRTGGPTIW